jgi:hypothetical protein
MIVAPEPTDEMIEAALIACGVTGSVRRQTMDAVRKNRGGPHEPGVCSQVRAVLAIINGVPLATIKRGYAG